MDQSDRNEAINVAAEDPTVEGLVADRTGLEKPVTFSGTVNRENRFCELCTYAQTAGFVSPEYRDGTAVCTTHARALVSGEWEIGDEYEVIPIRKVLPQ